MLLRGVSGILVEVRHGQQVIATVNSHELPWVLVLCYVPANVIPPDHHQAGTVACDYVRIARTLENEMEVTIALPSHIDTRVEAEPNLVPKPDSIGRVDGRFGETLDALHSVLDGRLE